MLDATEYLHLAIHASQEGNHHAALNYLNTALDQQSDNAVILYFLAAEHAELGLLERAHAGMNKVLELDPDLDIARFQLGLLSLQLHKVEEARGAFDLLQKTTQDISLKSFAAGYLDLLNEETQAAVANLTLGLATCSNLALKADMNRVLANLVDSAADLQSNNIARPGVFLGAYRDNLEVP